MGGSTVAILVFVGIVVLGGLLFMALYNRLVALRQQVKNAWSQIDVQLKRRHDLIPNLVETVKGYAGHEKATLENVTQARARAAGAQGVAEAARAEGELSAALGRLMLVVEQYPDLKANQNFLALQEELSSTENRIGFARQFYNDAVMQYNTRIGTVPSNFIASSFGFKEEAFFEIEDKAERAAPQVKF